MKNRASSDSALIWVYCKKCNQYANHRKSKNGKKLDCIYCESLRNKAKWGVSKSKPKGGWTKLKFKICK